ncbi:aspartate carbamoyltransferase, regulatory subunit [gut metagenome]|uniref:Aspartate carbamoyltransferase, regulatory subunit n=1 Tax=gut metagenome TaxID=749906 RepID=J9FN18_9ZZZZ
MKREQLKVAAIENGTVIDHIPSEKLFEVINLLRLSEYHSSNIVMGYNLKSNKLGHKSIIKIADKFFSDAELNSLSVIAPNATVCTIKDFELVEKKKVSLPSIVKGIVRCANPKCITNNEPMDTIFHLVDNEKGVLRCHYCEKEVNLDKVKLVEHL